MKGPAALSLKLRSADGLKYASFVLAAALSVPFNIASRIIFSYYIPFMIAIVLSQFVGMLVAFLLTRIFVFKSTRDSVIGELIRFAGVNTISLAQTWAVSVGLLYIAFPMVGYATAPELTAHVIGLATSSVTAFFGHRYYSFREGSTTPYRTGEYE